MGDIIYNYGFECFGVLERKQRLVPEKIKSRRQQEIERLVRERRRLEKQWKKAEDVDKTNINILHADIKSRLASLRRAEKLRESRKKKERTRSRFLKNPYKFAKTLFNNEKCGRLNVSRDELDDHLKRIFAEESHEPTPVPPDIPPLQHQGYQLDTNPPKWKEVQRVVRKARSASAPGPNGVPYRLYKCAPGVLCFLWRLMRVAWKKGIIPKAWRRAGGVLIPKEKDSTNIDQFRPISLLNVEGKMFFSIMASRITTYLQQNNLIDTTAQKAGIPGFSGCLEHTSMIWHRIQTARKEKGNLHVVFLDLANAFGSVPHSFLWAAFEYFRIPNTILTLLKTYFQDLQLCYTTPDFTTSWHPLKVGIMAGCTISPLMFTMAMEVIIKASKCAIEKEINEPEPNSPPIRAYMDDMTTITKTIPSTRRLLRKLHENIRRARMLIKSSKSRSISIVKGKLVNQKFFIENEPIPTVTEKPIKSLGRWYSSKLRDSEQTIKLKQVLMEGLECIDRTALLGKHKIWCLQFGLLPRLLWPLTVYEISLTKAESLEKIINNYVRKWLGVPRCLSSVALYGRGLLELPLSSLTEEYKCTKVRLEMTITESKDPVIRSHVPSQNTGKKWSAKNATLQAKSALHHSDIVGQVQSGRAGFGLGKRRTPWNKASPAERRKLVVEEIRQQEESDRRSKAVSQVKQGQWMNWEGVERRKISWRDLWNMEAASLSFRIRASYDVLPTPANLNQWLGEDP